MSIVYFLLLLLSLDFARSAAPDYAAVVDTQFLRERVTALQPERILRKFFENKENWKLNEGCARDLRIFAKDLELHRSWAMRSEIIQCLLDYFIYC